MLDKIELSSEQQEAVDLACDMDIDIATVTGGAGTGKTTILKQAFNELTSKHISTVLCAPTGRAAKRIKEATGIEAKTIHRLLEFPRPDDKDEGTKMVDIDDDAPPARGAPMHLPRRNAQRPLGYRAVLVDESSMVNNELYKFLREAMPRRGIIRLFGDMNQLPPVEGMSPFLQLMQSDPCVRLSYNFRSEDEIISNSLRLLRGLLPKPNNRFVILYNDRPLHHMIKFVTKEFMLPSHQVITPARKGEFGSVRANPSLQLKFNAKADALTLDRLDPKEAPINIRERDKFLWVKNDYTFEMFNGEIGVVDRVNPESGELWLGMEDRPTLLVPARAEGRGMYGKFFYDPRKQIEPGYVITTHKSQGSEFDVVVYYMCGNNPWLLNRNNFYTAITRARKQVIVICDTKAMSRSVQRKYA